MTMAPAARIACQSFQSFLRYAIVHAAENTTMPISNVSQEMKSVSMIFPIVPRAIRRPPRSTAPCSQTIALIFLRSLIPSHGSGCDLCWKTNRSDARAQIVWWCLRSKTEFSGLARKLWSVLRLCAFFFAPTPNQHSSDEGNSTSVRESDRDHSHVCYLLLPTLPIFKRRQKYQRNEISPLSLRGSDADEPVAAVNHAGCRVRQPFVRGLAGVIFPLGPASADFAAFLSRVRAEASSETEARGS